MTLWSHGSVYAQREMLQLWTDHGAAATEFPRPGTIPTDWRVGPFYARSLAPLTGRPRIVRSARLPSLTGGVHGRWDYRVIEVPGATATSQTVLEGF